MGGLPRAKPSQLQVKKETNMEKDYTLFGTKVIENKTHKTCLILYTWDNVFADATIPFATIVDKNGKKENVKMDDIIPLDDK